MHKPITAGSRFGRLTVIKLADKYPYGRPIYLCLCDCGKYFLGSATRMRQGKVRSCGCLSIDTTRQRCWKHGHKLRGVQSPTYVSWHGMFGRCRSPQNRYYADYGGRGISVCERWETFTNFLADMGERPSGTSIDRINNDGNYEPGNCRWATNSEQVSNRRSTRRVTAFGECFTVTQWARRTGLPYEAIIYRLDSGWEPERAVGQPSAGKQPKGELHPMSKLTEDDIRSIRQLSGRGISANRLAGWFGVQRQAVNKIVSGERWGHVQ